MKLYQHLHTINGHKRLVMKHCYRCGLYKQAWLHDLSKYSFVEFKVGVKYYQGYRSPNAAEREATGFSLAWLHHKGRNKHHFEYWIDYSRNPNEGIVGNEMPLCYVLEMFCDRVAASKNYLKGKYNDQAPLEYFTKERAKYIMHKNTDAMLYDLLCMLSEQGEDATFEFIKNKLVIPLKKRNDFWTYRLPSLNDYEKLFL